MQFSMLALLVGAKMLALRKRSADLRTECASRSCCKAPFGSFAAEDLNKDFGLPRGPSKVKHHLVGPVRPEIL